MPKVEWNGGQIESAAQQAVKEAAQMTAEVVKGAAVNLAPLEDSTLRGSATITELENGAEISFSTPYAVVMHESQNYTPSHSGTGPNYLRQPLIEAEDQYHQDVANALKGVLG